ncbi:MAG: alpha/beta hydrolase, partial [Sphingomicrobium sp.]
MSVPLLTIPGHMCDERLWSLIEPDLRSSGREVFHADIAGSSSVPALASAILSDAPGTFIPLALSMGGIVAFELVRQDPSRVAALVLSDTNAAPECPERAAVRREQQAKVRAGK